MKRLTGVIFLLSLFSAMHAQRILNLDSCRNLALQNNKSLRISEEKIKKAHYEQKAAFTKFLPSISASGTYMRFSDEISLLNNQQKASLGQMGTTFQNGLTEGLTPIIQQLAQSDPQLAMTIQQIVQSGGLNGVSGALNQIGQELTNAFRTDTRNVWAGAVLFTQPLYMGGKIRAYNQITKTSEQLAHNQHETELQEIILNTDEAYWTTVSLCYKKKLAESFLALINKLDKDMERLIQEGVATKADGLTVKVKMNEAEMTLTKVENGCALSKMLLCQLCGLDMNAPIVLADETNTDLSTLVESRPDAVETAINNRPELKSLALAQNIYDNKVKIARSEMLPTLALTGGYMVSNPSLLNGFENKFRGMWNVGVMLQIPILNWGAGFYKVKAARAEAHISTLELNDAQEKIELQVTQSQFKATEAQQRLVMALKNMEKAQENLNYANKGFKEGVIPVSNVMEAQTAWLAAQSEKIDAQIDIKMAETYLQRAIGTLSIK